VDYIADILKISTKMNNTHKDEILNFIDQTFANHTLLKSSIATYLKSPNKTNLFNKEFTENIDAPIQFQSLNSIKKRKKGEYGDISDVWTFYLNQELTTFEFTDFEFENYLNKGNQLNICKVWINWFLDVCYIETSFVKKSKTINETGNLILTKEYEIKLYEKIVKILEKNSHKNIDIHFLDKRLNNVKTDIEDNPTLFNCLFSDIILPTKNEREIRKKIGGIEVILKENLDKNRNVINKKMMFGNGNYNNIRIDFDNKNKLIKTLSHKEILKEEK
jgi:hypothetical protein